MVSELDRQFGDMPVGVEAAPMCYSQMLGNDQFDTLAERLRGRIAKQSGRGMIPANDRSRVVGTDDSVSDLIEKTIDELREELEKARIRAEAELTKSRAEFERKSAELRVVEPVPAPAAGQPVEAAKPVEVAP